VSWDDEAPPRGNVYIPVVSPRPNQQLHLLITSDRWKGVWTHYFDERTRPCTGTELDCDGCFRKLARRWKAYFCGVLPVSGKNCIIELTHGAMQSCPALLDKSASFRGRRLTLFRKNAARNAPVCVRLEGAAVDLFVPPSFDLLKALCNVWGINYTPLPTPSRGSDLTDPS